MCVPRAVCFSPTSTVVTENAPFFLRPSCNCSPLVSHCFEAKEKASLAQLIHSRFPANSPPFTEESNRRNYAKKKVRKAQNIPDTSSSTTIESGTIDKDFLPSFMESKDFVLVKQFKTVVTCAAFLGLVSVKASQFSTRKLSGAITKLTFLSLSCR